MATRTAEAINRDTYLGVKALAAAVGLNYFTLYKRIQNGARTPGGQHVRFPRGKFTPAGWKYRVRDVQEFDETLDRMAQEELAAAGN